MDGRKNTKEEPSVDARLLSINKPVSVRARAIPVEPVVELGAVTVTVKVITFSKWDGFVEQSYTVRRSFPHELLEQSAEILVPYDCGIMF